MTYFFITLKLLPTKLILYFALASVLSHSQMTWSQQTPQNKPEAHTQRESALEVSYRILTHPTSQKLFRVLNDPKVKNLYEDVTVRFSLNKYILAQLMALILILVLRVAFYPKRGLIKWILTDLWTGVFYLFMQIFLIPYALIGKPFFELISTLHKIWPS